MFQPSPAVDFCGIIRIICRRMLMGYCGGSGVLQYSQLQLLVQKSGRERLFLAYHASLIGGHLVRNRTLDPIEPAVLLVGYGR